MLDFAFANNYDSAMNNPLAGYVTAAKFAKRHKYSARRVQQLLSHADGPRIAGAFRDHRGYWWIPAAAKLPDSGIGGNPGFGNKLRRRRKSQRKAG